MSSDRIALDPLASSGDTTQRLVARVAELERQVSILRTPATNVKTVANNPSGFKIFTVAGPVTYTAKGGKVLIFAAAQGIVDATSGDLRLNLLTDSTQQDTSTVSIKPEGRVTTPTLAVPTMAYAPGTWTGDHTIQITQSSGSSLSNPRIIVIELPVGS